MCQVELFLKRKKLLRWSSAIYVHKAFNLWSQIAIDCYLSRVGSDHAESPRVISSSSSAVKLLRENDCNDFTPIIYPSAEIL
ncbi:hypothetical protein WN943_024549 [Citrus x changshan-huyou]